MTKADITVKADVGAKLSLLPKASQVYLLGSLLFASVCVICSTYLLLHNNQAGLIFALLSFVVVGVGAWGFIQSQSDIDMESAKATTVSLADGTRISTDSRNLRKPEAIQGLALLIEAGRRQSLPMADALIVNGEVVPDSANEANIRTMQINQEVEAQNAIFEGVLFGHAQPSVAQTGIDNVQLTGVEPVRRVN